MKGFLFKKNNFVKFFTLTLSASILGSWACFYWMTNGLGQVNLSLEGLNTCFSRVSQNYSGKMMGTEQVYTSSNFYQMTEECFSDLENVIKKSFFLQNNAPIMSDFKELVKKSYWFHRDDLTVNDFVDNEDDGTRALTKSYQEIESIFEQLQANISLAREEIHARKDWVFYLGLFSVVGLAIMAFVGNRSETNDVENNIASQPYYEEESLGYPQTSSTNTREHKISSIENISGKDNLLTPGPEKFEQFFNRFLKMIAPRMIRRGVNFDFFIDAGIPRILNPMDQQRELEIFFERSMSFNLSSGRVCRVDCYSLNPKKNELRFYDNGVCLLKTLKHFKNVKSTNGIVLGVEYKHAYNIEKKGKVKRLLKGKKKDLVKELSSTVRS